MVAVPSGIVFVNNDISPSVQNKIINQLFIDIILTGDEFDAIIDGYADYHKEIKKDNKRVLVIRPYDNNNIPNNIPNRELADIILFIKYALANLVTSSGHGPTFSVANIHWSEFRIF